MADRQPPDYEIDIVMGRMKDDPEFDFNMLADEKTFGEWAEAAFRPAVAGSWARGKDDPFGHARSLVESAEVGFGKMRQQGFIIGDIGIEFSAKTGKFARVRDLESGKFISKEEGKFRARGAFKLMGRR